MSTGVLPPGCLLCRRRLSLSWRKRGLMRDKKYTDVLQTFAGRKVLVIGDFILDVFLEGVSCRLSPEAPVPVVNVHKETVFAGGAGNTACNLAALGAHVTCCTVLGDDADGS